MVPTHKKSFNLRDNYRPVSDINSCDHMLVSEIEHFERYNSKDIISERYLYSHEFINELHSDATNPAGFYFNHRDQTAISVKCACESTVLSSILHYLLQYFGNLCSLVYRQEMTRVYTQ
jgi:hypothetical protein